ncbi:hypothetical protein EV663_1054 [Rhodovulum bhavnagarense]|uniref:N-(5'-phosphoribosyl)anthranilate isomerase n=1 Tax=Rhodovulum bhavnagarense TaxID=992286 RepID=A0A4R2RGR1_9RHOB|nr:N-(5'-phosphoribosyl)anthranilate isomerase [Rhodovulum bhavnagarense]TCP61287.1 hypothetical protein EV663_1054 [Rhodovulum bhavnagarense]
MTRLPDHMTPEIWMGQIFSSKSAREGGIVRRKLRDVERLIGWEAFETELRRRGYHAIENSGQIVIFCNNAPVRVVC